MTAMPEPPGHDPAPVDASGARLRAWTNGLLAESYVPLTDVAVAVAPQLLSALQRARIAAYLAETGSADALRLYVASAERVDARGVVAAVVRAARAGSGEIVAAEGDQTDPGRTTGGTAPAGTAPAGTVPAGTTAPGGTLDDPLAGIDTDAAFAEIVADWHVDTHRAIRDAERQLSAEDEDWRARLHPPAATDDDWLDDDHFVPPTPPPLPRLTVSTVLAVMLIAVSIMLLGFGGDLGIPFELSLFLGVSGVLTALGLLVMRLRVRPDEDDDGAVL